MEFSEEMIGQIEVLNLYLNKDIKSVKNFLNRFTDILIYLNEVLVEKKIIFSENLIFSEQLLVKFYLHGLTINKISDCYTLESHFFNNDNLSKVKAIDISSLLTIVRAQFETLIVYQYLYINTQDKEEQDFRFQCWILESLISRTTIFNTEEISDKNLQNEFTASRNKDLISIEIIREKIKTFKSFQILDNNQQNRLLETGKLKSMQSIDKMFSESNLAKSDMFSKVYYNLSAYAHSEGLVAIQLKQSRYFMDNDHNINMTHLYVFYSLAMTAVMIKNITEIFEEVKLRYDSLEPKIITQIDLLYQLAIKK